MFLLLPKTRREQAGTAFNHQNVKNGAAQKSLRLPMYHHGGYQVYDHEIFYNFFYFIYIITISFAVEEDEEF